MQVPKPDMTEEQKQEMLQLESANANALQGSNPQNRTTITIEEALQHVDKVSEDQFVNEANNMIFRMNDFNKVTELINSD